jgi:transposase
MVAIDLPYRSNTGNTTERTWGVHLEDQFTLLLVNARHVKAVPGRTTDVRDCERLAELLRHGLLTGSVIPDRPQRELRELTRYRTSRVRERTAEANRLQKTLEGATITLASVAIDILSKSGREILTALIAGETDSVELAQRLHGRLREKLPQVAQALVGRVGPHQRYLVAQHLAHIDCLDEGIAQVSAEIAARCALAAQVPEPRYNNG